MRFSRRSTRIATGIVALVAVAAGAAAAAILGAPPTSAPPAGSALTPPAPAVAQESSSVRVAPSSPARVAGSAARPTSRVAWALAPGWSYDMDCPDDRCDLHLTGPDGSEAAGWPVRLEGSCHDEAAVGPEERVFVACERGREVEVTGLDRTGAVLPGWPVRVPGKVAWSTWNDFAWGPGTSLAVSPDETVYVAVNDPRYTIHGLTQAGEPRPGWPHVLQGEAQGFLTAADGAVVAWWFEGLVEAIGLDARRTRFTVLDPGGSTLPGWPIGSKGAASGPVVTDDGTLVYTSATGKVYGHDRTGQVVAGWPYLLDERAAPQLRADGMLLFVGGADVAVLDTRGRAVPGWPYRTNASLIGPGCDTPSFGYSVVATGPDDSLYLAERREDRTDIVRVDRHGALVSGWPFRVPRGWGVTWLVPDATGELAVHMSADWCGDGQPWLRLSATGQQLTPVLPTPLESVYDALRLTPIETEAGRTSYQVAEGIVFELGLVNESSDRIILMPAGDDDADPDGPYAAGAIQTWLERLGPDPSLDACMPDAVRLGTWYGVAGWDMRSQEPVTIEPGGSMWTERRASLPSNRTWCLPPGEYRFHAQYLRLDSFVDEEMGEVDGVIDQRALDLTITPARPTPAPPAQPEPTMTPLVPSPPATPRGVPSPFRSPLPSPSPSDRPSPS